MNPSIYFSQEFNERIWPTFRLELKSSETEKKYFYCLCAICNFLEKDFLDISVEDAYRYVSFLESRYHAGTLAIRTINHRISVFRKLGHFISERGLLDGYVNPFFCIKQVAVNDDVTVTSFPSMREFDMILSAAKSDDAMFLILALAGRVGLSASSIVKLHINHIVAKDDIMCIVFPGKNAVEDDQVIALPADVKKIMTDYIEKHPSVDGYLFHNKYGKPLSLKTLGTAVDRVVSASGVEKKYTLRNFRTRAILDLKKSGVSNAVISKYVGLSHLRLSSFENAIGVVGDCPADLVNFCLKS